MKTLESRKVKKLIADAEKSKLVIAKERDKLLRDEYADNCSSGNTWVAAAAIEALQAENARLADENATLTKQRDISRIAMRNRGRNLLVDRDVLKRVVDGLVDEDDRVYLESTNDADDLRSISDAREQLAWTKIMSESEEIDWPKLADDRLDRAEIAESKLAKARDALKVADEFITNGIELGFIRMPDKSTPDRAHDTPAIVRKAYEETK